MNAVLLVGLTSRPLLCRGYGDAIFVCFVTRYNKGR
jgi:hypothetical protein